MDRGFVTGMSKGRGGAKGGMQRTRERRGHLVKSRSGKVRSKRRIMT